MTTKPRNPFAAGPPQSREQGRRPQLLIFDQYGTTPDIPGYRRNFDLAVELQRRGWDVRFIACRFHHWSRRYLPRAHERHEDVEFFWSLGTPYRGKVAREVNALTFAASAFTRGARLPADAVIACVPPVEVALAAERLARMKRATFVLAIEDLFPESLVAMGMSPAHPLVLFQRVIERHLYAAAAHITVIAASQGKYLEKAGVAPERISLVPLGASLAGTTEARESVRARYGWRPSDVICSYLGAQGPAQALDVVLGAADRLQRDGLRFSFVGNGTDKPRLERKAAEMGLAHVEFHDPVPPNDVPALLRAVDIGIACLKRVDLLAGARPTKLFEYMEASLPIACAIDGEAREFVEEVGAGVGCRAEDPDELARVLDGLARDPERRRAMGERGRRYIVESGNRARIAAQLDDILRATLARPGVAAPSVHEPHSIG